MKNIVFFLFFSFTYFTLYAQHKVYPVIWLQSETIESGQGYWQDAANMWRKATPENKDRFPGATWFNYNKALALDNISNSLKIPYAADKQSSMTVILVYHTRDTVVQGLWQLNQDSITRAFLTTRQLNSGSSIRYTDTGITIPAIHTYAPAFRKKLQGNCAFTIGSSDSMPFYGRIAEFMVYDKSLKGEELQKVQTYLALKYGVSLIQTHYLSSEGTVLWDTLADKAYWHSIAGIGRDDAFGLQQKQSLSTSREDYIVLGAHAIYAHNQANPSLLSDHDFLVWGHNARAFALGHESSLSGGQFIERQWKIRRSGTSAHTLPTALVIDAGKLPEKARQDCRLWIDRSGKGDFDDPEASILPYKIDSTGKIYFQDIYWDTDLSGTDLFTFSFYEPADTTVTGETGKETAGNGNDSGNTDGKHSGNSGKESTPLTGERSPFYKLSPNPSRGYYVLEITFPEAVTAHVRILDTQGKKVEEKSLQNDHAYRFEGQISTPGVYLIEVESPYETQTFKLIYCCPVKP